MDFSGNENDMLWIEMGNSFNISKREVTYLIGAWALIQYKDVILPV